MLNLQDPKNRALVQAVAAEILNSSPQVRAAADLVCDARALPAGSRPAWSPATSTGGGESCGCKLPGGGAKPIPATNGGGCGPAIPGGWNFEPFRSDVAPCDIERISRVFTFQSVTYTGTETSTFPLSMIDSSHAALIVPSVLVSHTLCVEGFSIEVTGTDVGTPTITMVGLQGERIYQDPNGEFVHAWNDLVFEKPAQLETTEGRCACRELCACLPAQAAARIILTISGLANPLPNDFAITVTADFRRREWQSVCGQCPPELLCGREELTTTYSPQVEPGSIPQYPPSTIS